MRSIWRSAASSCSLLNSGTDFTGAASAETRLKAADCAAACWLAMAMGLPLRPAQSARPPGASLEHFRARGQRTDIGNRGQKLELVRRAAGALAVSGFRLLTSGFRIRTRSLGWA